MASNSGRCGLFQSTSSVWRTTHFYKLFAKTAKFQSTSSVWRTTCIPAHVGAPKAISIHVLRVEDDVFWCSSQPGIWNFNPRPPCGGRRRRDKDNVAFGKFQSTSSVWRTTAVFASIAYERGISIHVLRVEDDKSYQLLGGADGTFQSTSSVWRTTGCIRPA